jgi:hypothetical protein
MRHTDQFSSPKEAKLPNYTIIHPDGSNVNFFRPNHNHDVVAVWPRAVAVEILTTSNIEYANPMNSRQHFKTDNRCSGVLLQVMWSNYPS